MLKFTTSLAAAALIYAVSGVAYAQSTQVTQTATRADASQFLQGQAGASACSSVNTSVANNTVTMTPPAGMFVYLTGFYADITADATGTTQVTTINTTNLVGNPHWSSATIVPTAGANGTFRQISEAFATPLKAAAVGVAVTFAPSAATLTDTIVCMRVAGFFAP